MAEADESSSAEPNGTARSEGKIRSETSYPYYGLSKGIEILEAVRRAGGSNATNADVMREMGVSKVSDRNWAYGIPAATYFGLIERVGRGNEGQIKITELGLRVALPGTPEEGRLAKVAAFSKPELYAKLLEKFTGHPVPGKEGLKNILYRDFKIVESMAPIAADAFLDSLKVAGLITEAGIIAHDAADGGVEAGKSKSQVEKRQQDEGRMPGTQAITVPADFIIYRCKIGKGRIIEIPLPPDFKTADVKRLYAFLKTQVDDVDEAQDEPQDD
jgi:hypothetical protein